MARGSKQQKGINQASTLIGFAQDTEPVKIPDGVEFTEQEMVTWSYLTSARVKSSWRPIDLMYIVEMVRLETRIIAIKKQIEEEGDLTENRFGELVKNPRITVYDTLFKQRMSLCRRLSLTEFEGKAETNNAQGAKANEVTDAVKSFNNRLRLAK